MPIQDRQADRQARNNYEGFWKDPVAVIYQANDVCQYAYRGQLAIIEISL